MNISVASSSSAKTIGMILLISGELVSLMASTKSPSPLGHLPGGERSGIHNVASGDDIARIGLGTTSAAWPRQCRGRGGWT
jgi:hypothetical protein